MELLPMLPALIGAGGAVAGLAKGSPTGNVQQPFNSLQAANAILPWAGDFGFNDLKTAPNPAASTLGNYSDIVQNYFLHNPGAAGMTSGAGGAANMGGAAANSIYGSGNFLSGLGQSLTPYAGSILNTAFDPQNLLYDRTQHQLQEQVRSGEAARGLGKSPFGAGLENKAMSDFNLDWNDRQLGRQVTGAGGASGLLGTGNQLIQGGSSLMSQAPGLLSQTSMLPYMAYNQIGGNQLGALQGYGQQGMAATQMPQQILQDFYQALGLGNNSASTANSAFGNQLYQQNSAFGQNQALGAGLGKGLAGLNTGGTTSGGTGWQVPGNFGNFGQGSSAFPDPAGIGGWS